MRKGRAALRNALILGATIVGLLIIAAIIARGVAP
jgi:mannose/fructose/N-acetylgalactosamine-specific phosphotransferase system component IID